MNTAIVKSGNDLVRAETGEVVETTFSMQDYLASVLPDAALAVQQKLAAAYDKACTALIGPNDVQKEGSRTFKKKSAWRKLARHFCISTAVVQVQRDIIEGSFLATVTVKASGPWGQSTEAVGACGQDEATGRRTITIADAIATAETRATNRAISNLIAMGEVSAEEMSGKGNDRPQSIEQKPAEQKRMPFGKRKGVPLGDFNDEDLQSAMKWCREKDAYKDVVDAIVTVLRNRHGESAVQEADEMQAENKAARTKGNAMDPQDYHEESFPAALNNNEDDLPF
jgi:hypothetical protein